MFNKQKRSFWRTSFVFAIISMLVLALSWDNTSENAAQMDNSMAAMMSSEHLDNATMADLFNSEMTDGTGLQAAGGEHAEHHSRKGRLYTMHIISTALLLFSLPVITAGSLFLAIVWPRQPIRGEAK